MLLDSMTESVRAPVFVDELGRRRRWVRTGAAVLCLMAAGYVTVLGLALTGAPWVPRVVLPGVGRIHDVVNRPLGGAAVASAGHAHLSPGPRTALPRGAQSPPAIPVHVVDQPGNGRLGLSGGAAPAKFAPLPTIGPSVHSGVSSGTPRTTQPPSAPQTTVPSTTPAPTTTTTRPGRHLGTTHARRP